MNNEKVINRLRNACGIIILILIAIMAALQVVAPNVLRRVIMCHFILLLITVTLVCDGILKDSKGFALRCIVYAIWLNHLIMSLLII